MVAWAKTHAVGGVTNPLLSVHGPEHPHYSSMCLDLFDEFRHDSSN